MLTNGLSPKLSKFAPDAKSSSIKIKAGMMLSKYFSGVIIRIKKFSPSLWIMVHAWLVNSVGGWRVAAGAEVGTEVDLGLGGSLVHATASTTTAKTAQRLISAKNMYTLTVHMGYTSRLKHQIAGAQVLNCLRPGAPFW